VLLAKLAQDQGLILDESTAEYVRRKTSENGGK